MRSSLTFTEDKVALDVEGLNLDVVDGDGDSLLVVAGDHGERLLSRAHVRASGGSHQR